MRYLKRILFVLLSVYLSACTNYGSSQLPLDRFSYNDTMQYSDAQQNLLNIVRLRYTDRPYFLELNNVVSQLNLTKSLSLAIVNGLVPGIVGTGTGNVSVSETPTITYSPLQGPDAIQRLMTPFDLGMIYYLMRSGWSVDKVIRLTLLRFGSYENALLASRQAGSIVPVYKKFQDLGLVLRSIEHAGDLSVKLIKLDGQSAIKIKFRLTSKLSANERKVLRAIGVTPQTPYFWMVGHPTKVAHQYYAQARTAMELFNYLAKGVDVPAEDYAAGYVRRTFYPNHTEFDWHLITRGQIRVHFSRSRPRNAYLSVHYRNLWFYIADNALYTKETLMMLGILMSAVQGEVKSVLPIFTVQ